MFVAYPFLGKDLFWLMCFKMGWWHQWLDCKLSRHLQEFNQWNNYYSSLGRMAMKLCWFLLMFRGEKRWTWWYWRRSGIVSAGDLLLNMDWSVMFVMFIKDNAGIWFWSFSMLHVCLDLVKRLTIHQTIRTCHFWGLTAPNKKESFSNHHVPRPNCQCYLMLKKIT